MSMLQFETDSSGFDIDLSENKPEKIKLEKSGRYGFEDKYGKINIQSYEISLDDMNVSTYDNQPIEPSIQIQYRSLNPKGIVVDFWINFDDVMLLSAYINNVIKMRELRIEKQNRINHE